MTPDFILEKKLLRELSPAEDAALEQELALDPALRHRLAALSADNAETLAAHPPATVTAEVKRRAGARIVAVGATSQRRRWALIPLALATVLALVVITRGVSAPTPSGEIRVKGGAPGLRIFRQQGGRAVAIPNGDVVPAGSVVQLGYNAHGAPFGVLFSIDGRGTVTLHQPARSTDGALLEENERVLPTAYRLDDAPGFERFFFVTSAERFEVETILAAGRRLAASPAAPTASLALPSSFQATGFLLRKPAP